MFFNKHTSRWLFASPDWSPGETPGLRRHCTQYPKSLRPRPCLKHRSVKREGRRGQRAEKSREISRVGSRALVQDYSLSQVEPGNHAVGTAVATALLFVASGTNALTNHDNSGSDGTTEGWMYLKPLGYKISWI